MVEKIKAALLVDSSDLELSSDFNSYNSDQSIDLQVLEKGQGRKKFLDKAKKLLLDNKTKKNFSEDDIRALEEELDLVINISKSQSLENALVTGLNYAEIVFVKKDLRDFSFADYKAAVEEFRLRQRNFGK